MRLYLLSIILLAASSVFAGGEQGIARTIDKEKSMTVQTSDSIANFNGNGTATDFPIAFKFNSAADLVVLLINSDGNFSVQSLNSDYTVSGAGDDEGGAIHFISPPSSQQKVKVLRVVDILQLTDLRNQGEFYAEVHEDVFDLLVMIAQQQQAAIETAIRVPDTDPAPSRLPSVLSRANKIMAFDVNGDPIAIVAASGSAEDLAIALAGSGGAGIVGYSSTQSYPAGTVGGELLPKVNGQVLQKPTTAGGTPHMLVTRSIPGAPRVHVEPNGHVYEGTTTKYDFMFTPFDADQANYRIFNIFTKNGANLLNSGQNGENGVTYLGTKSVGDEFGLWPSMHFGFGDERSPTSVPMKVYYFDTSDSAWRVPMMGAWKAGRTVTAGDYMLANFKLYQAATGGTAGSTKPSHATGTVSDGAIDWTFVRDFQSSLNNIHGTVLIGNRDQMPKFGLPNARLQLGKQTAVWNGEKITFLDNTDQPAVSIHANGGTDDLHILSEKTRGYLRLDATSGFIQNNGWEWLMSPKTFSAGETSVSLAGVELVSFNNSAATSVSAFTGRAYQRFYVESKNGNTTLVQGANIKLAGAANKTMSTNDVIGFVMDSSGTVARQL